MVFTKFKNTVLLFVIVFLSCIDSKTVGDRFDTTQDPEQKPITVGANRTDIYLPLLQGKKVGIVANQTSVIFGDAGKQTHVVDSLVALDVNLKKVFAPEHGFRGKADAGELVKDGIDTKTNLPIVSLYGKNKKPSAKQLDDLDVVIFDIQDVGARFYTYISSLHYVMEACAELDIPMIILDRPNPNGHYVDDPILEKAHQSFVGMHPIPIVHGMTIGEYANMINGQGWLKDGIKCHITVIHMKDYWHNKSYSIPIKPSPNLPNDISINLYPSLCFFEGTNVSAGRGTQTQFQIFGSPDLNKDHYSYSFTPESNEGAKYPKHQGELCYGSDLRQEAPLTSIHLDWLIEAYKHTADRSTFFNDFFSKLAGTSSLREQIEAGLSAEEIYASWQTGLDSFKEIRKTYLLYN